MNKTEMTQLKGKTSKVDQNFEIRRYCSFYLADRLFGVDINSVKEINDEVQFTYISHAPKVVRGYVNIRGQIFLVLDLCYLMGIEKRNAPENGKLILFKTDVLENCGIFIDGVGDIVDVRVDKIEDRRKNRADKKLDIDRRKDFSQIGAGVCKLEHQLMVIIDPRKLPNAVEESVSNRF